MLMMTRLARSFRFFLAPLAACAALASAQTPPPAAPAPGAKVSDEALLSYLPKDGAPAGTIPWLTFRQVKLVEEKKDGKTVLRPEFGAAVKGLDKKSVKLYGFVLPLSTTTKQKHFLLSPLPTHCPFCVSQGPDSMIEVLARIPIEFSLYDPVIVAGRLELVNDSSLFYRLVDAEPVKP
jgi:uncharacterized protein